MLLLRGGRLVHPGLELDTVGDLLVGADGARAATTAQAEAALSQGAKSVEVDGCWVLPGFVDLRTHLREPGEEHKETIQSGLLAAAAGGYSAVCAMPGTVPPNDRRTVTDSILSGARGGAARLWPFGAITMGLEGKALTEMSELKDAGIVGVTDDLHSVTDPSLLRRAMEYARTFDLLLAQHCEEPMLAAGGLMHEGVVSTQLGIRGAPRQAEDAAVARDLRVAELTGARFHVSHVSSAGAVALIRDAKARGVAVSADCTPHHLTYIDEDVIGFNTQMRVVPPLRSESDREALRAAVADGTIDAISTDHAPHVELEKRCEFDVAAPGMIGLELALPLTLALVRDGHLSRSRWADAMSLAPARVLRKAESFARGDVTVVDPEAKWTVTASSLRSKSRNTPLLGQQVLGRARMTIVGGRITHAIEDAS